MTAGINFPTTNTQRLDLNQDGQPDTRTTRGETKVDVKPDHVKPGVVDVTVEEQGSIETELTKPNPTAVTDARTMARSEEAAYRQQLFSLHNISPDEAVISNDGNRVTAEVNRDLDNNGTKDSFRYDVQLSEEKQDNGNVSLKWSGGSTVNYQDVDPSQVDPSIASNDTASPVTLKGELKDLNTFREGTKLSEAQRDGSYVAAESGVAVQEGTHGPRVEEYQGALSDNLKSFGLEADTITDLLDPGGSNKGGAVDGYYGQDTRRATEVHDKLLSLHEQGKLTSDHLAALAEGKPLDSVTAPPATPKRRGVLPQVQPPSVKTQPTETAETKPTETAETKPTETAETKPTETAPRKPATDIELRRMANSMRMDMRGWGDTDDLGMASKLARLSPDEMSRLRAIYPEVSGGQTLSEAVRSDFEGKELLGTGIGGPGAMVQLIEGNRAGPKDFDETQAFDDAKTIDEALRLKWNEPSTWIDNGKLEAMNGIFANRSPEQLRAIEAEFDRGGYEGTLRETLESTLSLLPKHRAVLLGILDAAQP